jgi:hypothetical protein
VSFVGQLLSSVCNTYPLQLMSLDSTLCVLAPSLVHAQLFHSLPSCTRALTCTRNQIHSTPALWRTAPVRTWLCVGHEGRVLVLHAENETLNFPMPITQLTHRTRAHHNTCARAHAMCHSPGVCALHSGRHRLSGHVHLLRRLVMTLCYVAGLCARVVLQI